MSEAAAAVTPGVSRWRSLWLPALAGAIAGLGQVPFALVPVGLAGLVVAIASAVTAPDARAAAWRGFAAGTGYFAVTLHWIVEPFLIDVARHGWMAPFALVFISTGFALFWATAFAFGRWVGGGSPVLRALGIGVALAAVEMGRSFVLTGFPWALIGYVWSEGPGAQLAAIVGSYGLTALTTLAVAAVAMLRGWTLRACGVLVVWGAVAGAGWALRPAPLAPAEGAPVVRLVQPNAPQDEKWEAESAYRFFDRQLAFTAAAGAPDLIIWPETSIPYLIEDGHPALARVAAAAGGAPVVLGAQRVDGLRAFNTLVLVGSDGRIEDSYDKHHLVPFGEYMPFGQITRALGLRSFAARDGFGYSAGPGPRLLDLGALGRVLPLICYEAIFPQDVGRAQARPDWLLQITNDAWFGTFAGPQQHLAQARMRAIEQGLPMVRVANTGISAMIDAEGRVRDAIPLGEAGYLDRALPPARDATPYARTGDLPLALILVAALAGLAVRGRKMSG